MHAADKAKSLQYSSLLATCCGSWTIPDRGRDRIGSGAHPPASYSMGTRCSLFEGKGSGAWTWLLTSI